MKKENVIYRKKKDSQGVVEYHVLGLEDSDFFDTLISFFSKNYNTEISVKDEGTNTRSYQLRCRNEYFILKHNSDIGNWFYSCQPSGDSELMEEIAADLENRLKDVSYE